AGGRAQELEAEITDRSKANTMEWQTTKGPDLAGTFTLLPIDRTHTRIQARIEYDPDTVKTLSQSIFARPPRTRPISERGERTR
ncbi:hypothetical protein ACH492_39600, partial [Streptomyces sp. NPDC019443]